MNKFNDDTSKKAVSVEADEHKVYDEDMYKRISYSNTVPDSRMFVFLAGFCLGMVFFYLCRSVIKNENPFDAVVSAQKLSQLESIFDYKAGLLEYVAGIRAGQLIILLLCATSFAGGVIAYGILGWCGFELGMMVFAAMYQYGIIGLLFSMLLLTPHEIFYFLAVLILFQKWFIKDGKNGCDGNCVSEKKGWRKRAIEVRKVIIVLILFMAGILSEVYINSEIVKRLIIAL